MTSLEKNTDELRKIAKQLRLLGKEDISKKVLFAIAAITGGDAPRADLSYSFIMRELRNNDKDKVKEFQEKFKDSFESALDQDIENPVDVALLNTIENMGLSF